MVEKTGDVEAKANLQSPFHIREIDSRCPKNHRPLVKKDKEDTYREPRNKASNKDKNQAKSHNSSVATNQPQTWAPKKNKRARWGGYLATGVNDTKEAKKDKDKASMDLGHVECYTCHQKVHFANKCSEKKKN